MADTERSSDLGTGLSLLLGFVTVAAAVAVAGTAYLAETESSETMQLFSGVALTVALVAGGFAVVAVQLLD